MPKKLPGFTTGEVQGQIGLTANTLGTYISEFREYFTDGVTRRTRGKRWTRKDINNVLVIRMMKSRHQKHQAIADELATGRTFEEVSPTLNAAVMLDVSMRNLQQIAKYTQEVKEMTRTAAWNSREYTTLIKWIEKNFKFFQRAIKKHQFQITLIEFYLKNPLRRYPINKIYLPIYNAIMKVIDNWLYVSDDEMRTVGAILRDLGEDDK